LIGQGRSEAVDVVKLSSVIWLYADHVPGGIDQAYKRGLFALIVGYAEEDSMTVADIPIKPSCRQPLPVEGADIHES
jgi:hypothetical protein